MNACPHEPVTLRPDELEIPDLLWHEIRAISTNYILFCLKKIYPFARTKFPIVRRWYYRRFVRVRLKEEEEKEKRELSRNGSLVSSRQPPSRGLT